MQAEKSRNWWIIAFVVYGVLSLSSMAGMSIGLGIFGAATLWFFAAEWRRSGKKILAEAFATPFSSTSLALFFASLLSLVAVMIYPVEGSIAGPLLSSLKKYHYYIFPPLFAAAFLHSDKSLEEHSFWKPYMVFSAILGIISMVQFFGASLFPEAWMQSSFFRQEGTTGRYHGQGLMFFHLSFASSMCFTTAAGWARVIFPRPNDSSRTRALWAVAALLSSLGVYFSYSRTAFFALALVLVVLGFLKRPLWGLLVSLFIALLGSGLWLWSESLYRRWADNQAGNRERFVMWKTAWSMFLDRPLTGVGFSRTGELSPYYAKYVAQIPTYFTSHAHNNVLDMLAATGSIGFAAYLAWWGFLMWAAFWSFRRAPESERWLPAAAFAGFLSFHVNGLTQVNYWDGKSEHTLMVWAGVAIALWIREKKRV